MGTGGTPAKRAEVFSSAGDVGGGVEAMCQVRINTLAKVDIKV